MMDRIVAFKRRKYGLFKLVNMTIKYKKKKNLWAFCTNKICKEKLVECYVNEL